MTARPRPRGRRTAAAVLATVGALVVGIALPAQLVSAASSVDTPVLRATQAASVASSAPGSRPNILVIETDDMRADDLRFMPETNRLIAMRGLRFENSFSPSPLCCPARASFLTGKYSHNHGVHTHLPPYGFASFDDRTTLATALRGVGYRTGMVGKYLNGYGFQKLRAQHPAPGASSLTYVPPGWTQWFGGVDQGVEENARATPGRGGTYQYFGLGQNINGKIKTARGYSADVMGKQVRTMVDKFGKGTVVKVKVKGKKKKRKVKRAAPPWFVWWTPIAPHHGSPVEADDPGVVVRDDGYGVKIDTPARPAWAKGRFNGAVTRAPGVRADGTTESDVSDKPRWMQRPEVNAAEQAAMLNATRQRAESLLALDRQIGQTLTRLYRSKQGKRTVVVFTSDNGYYLGEHRITQGKGTLLEPSIRVPLLMSGPGIPQGTRYDPATSIDFAPTLAAMAGAQLPAMDGVDLGPTIRSGDQGWRRAVQTEALLPMDNQQASSVTPGPLNLRGLRLGRWSFTRYANGEKELYDLRADPLQLENLAAQESYADTLARLQQVLASYETCSGAACAAPLPPDLALTAAENRALTTNQVAATQAYYG